MEEEIITPEEVVFDYKKLRYILTSDGYVCHASLGGLILCDLGECTEYNGDIPEGYETIEEWYEEEIERLNSWKVVDGNLVFDENRDYKLKIKYEQENNENSHVTRKEMGMASTEEINPYTDLYPSHQSAGGYITSLDGTFNKVGNLPTEEVNLSVLEEQDLDLIELEFIGNNFLPNTAISSVNNGIEYTQNKDKTINVSGTATDRSTLNLAGTDTSVRNVLTFKADTKYLLFGLEGLSLEFYHYDGTDRTLIGSYSGGVISFEEDINITQVVLVVDKGTTINTTIKPTLQKVYLEHPVMQMTKYKGNLYDYQDVKNISTGVTTDEDGYITMSYDNTNGSSTQYLNYHTNNLDLDVSKNYKVFVEVKNVSGTGSLTSVNAHASSQFQTVYYLNFSDLSSNNIYSSIVTTKDDFASSSNGLRTFVAFGAGQSGSVTFRLSLVEDTSITGDTFKYEPYNGRDGQYYIDGVSTQETRSGNNKFNATLLNGKQKIQVNEDGSKITLPLVTTGNGSSNTGIKLSVLAPELKVGDTVYLSFDPSYDTRNKYIYLLGAEILWNINTYKTITQEMLDSNVNLYANRYNSGETEQLILSNFRMVLGQSDIPFEPYGISPSPDYPSEIINIYKAGTYNAIAGNKIYTFTIPEDLRGLPNGVGDRLWLDVDGGIDIEKKVGIVVLDGSDNWLNWSGFPSNDFIGFYLPNVLNYNYSSGNDIRGISNHFEVAVNGVTNRQTLGLRQKGDYSQIYISINKSIVTNLEEFKTWLSTHNTEVQYELATYTASFLPEFSHNEYEYEEYKNNTTLIDLAGNELTIPDKIAIKDNQIVLIKNGSVISETTKEEIYLGDTVMPRTYTPYTNVYCHQKVYIDFKYKDPRNVDITKINLKGLISITNIETEYNFTSDDLIKVRNYIMGEETLTESEIELYDINGDGVITSYDYVMIKQMIDGTISNKITGTLEINSTKSQRTLVLRDEEGKILTSLGLNGMTTPSLSIDGGKVYGEHVLFEGNSNGNITLNDNTSKYDYIEIFYRDNQGQHYGNQKLEVTDGVKTTLSLTPYYINDAGVYSYIYNAGITINGNTITRIENTYLQIHNQTIGQHNTSNYIYIYRVVGYRGGMVKETEQPDDTETPVDNTKTISDDGSKGHHTFTLEVNENSISGNKSILDYSFKLSPIQKNWDWASWGNKISYSITIGDNSYNGTIPAYDGVSTVTLKSGSNIEIEHNADGTKTIPISFTVTDGAAQNYTCGNASASGSFTLTEI